MFTMLLVERSSKTGLFRHLSNHVFGVRNSGNTKALRVIFFFQNIQTLMEISKEQKNIEKTFVVFEIIASELVSLNCLY